MAFTLQPLQVPLSGALDASLTPFTCFGIATNPLGVGLLLLVYGTIMVGFLSVSWTAMLSLIFSRISSFLWLSLASLAAGCYYFASNATLLRILCADDLAMHPFVLPMIAAVLILCFLLFLIALVARNRIVVRGARRLTAAVVVLVVLNIVGGWWSDRASDLALALSALACVIFVGALPRLSADRRFADMLAFTALLAGYCLVQQITPISAALANRPFTALIGNLDELINTVSAIAGLILFNMWFKQIGVRQKAARTMLAKWQADEHSRLKREVARQTDALKNAFIYAEEKNRQKVQTLGYVGHDLRAPMATVLGYVRLLRSSHQAPDPAHLSAIERSVHYQLALIDDILDYAKAELQPLHIEPTSTGMTALFDELVPHARILGRANQNRFVYHLPSHIPAGLWVDGTRLRQVLLNLLSNASKYTLRGTFGLTVDARPHARPDVWRFTFSVEDDGIGIDMTQQASIFDAFNQLERTRGGVGLGLFIAEQIVEGLGGKLSLDSVLGKGSLFSFEIDLGVTDDTLVAVTSGTSGDVAPPPLSSCEPISYPYPPAAARLELALLARDGQITGIEEWLSFATQTQPEFDAFYDDVRDALAKLDLERLESLALQT